MSSNIEAQIEGEVYDSANHPLSYATVILVDVNDSILVKGEITGEDGTYNFFGIE